MPRRRGNPWKKRNRKGALKEEEKTEETILRMAPCAKNLIECVPQVTPGNKKQETSLLGYYWNTHQDVLSTNKKEVLNLHPARRGVKPQAFDIHEASDLLRLHQIKPLKHRQALSAAHSLYDPVQAASFLATQLKFMYRYLIINNCLENAEESGSTDYDAELSQYFLQEHLFYAVEGILQTKRRLNTTQSWQLPACVDRKTIRLSIDTIADEAWGCLAGSACIVYNLQRYQFRGQARTSIILYVSATGMNSLTKLTHQVDAELAAIHLTVKERNKCLTNLRTST